MTLVVRIIIIIIIISSSSSSNNHDNNDNDDNNNNSSNSTKEEMHHRGDFVPEELREFIRARDQRILSSVAVSPAPSSGAGGR